MLGNVLPAFSLSPIDSRTQHLSLELGLGGCVDQKVDRKIPGSQVHKRQALPSDKWDVCVGDDEHVVIAVRRRLPSGAGPEEDNSLDVESLPQSIPDIIQDLCFAHFWCTLPLE